MDQLTNQLRRILPKNRFAREVSVLVGGTAGGHVVAVLAAPLLTRLYRPEDFGLLAVFAALMSIAGVVSGLRYPSAIVLPDKDREADALLVLSVLVVSVFSGAVAILLLPFSQELAALLNMPPLAAYLYLLPVGVFAVGAYHAFNVVAIRDKAFTPVAKTRLTQSLGMLGIQLAGAPFGAVALLLGHVGGHAAATFSLMQRMLRGRWRRLARLRLPALREVAWRYRYFPLCGAWIALFNTAGAQLPSILFAMMFSPTAAGIYALANRVLSAPVQLLSQATSDVFYSRAAEARREGRLALLTSTTYSRLTQIAMPPALALVAAGPEIFVRAFGPAWHDAGIFSQWLAPWLYLEVVTAPLTSVFAVVEKLGTRLAFESVALVVRLLGIVAGAAIGDAMTAVALLAAGSIACRTAMLVCLARIAGIRSRAVWRPPLATLLWSLPLVSPLLLSRLWSADDALWLGALAATAALIAARYASLMKLAWA